MEPSTVNLQLIVSLTTPDDKNNDWELFQTAKGNTIRTMSTAKLFAEVRALSTHAKTGPQRSIKLHAQLNRMQQKHYPLSSMEHPTAELNVVESGAIVEAIVEAEANLMGGFRGSQPWWTSWSWKEENLRSVPTSIQTSSALATMSKGMTSTISMQQRRRRRI